MPRKKILISEELPSDNPNPNSKSIDIYICYLILHDRLNLPFDTTDFVDIIYKYLSEEMNFNEEMEDIFNELFVNTNGYKNILKNISINQVVLSYIKSALYIQKKVSLRKKNKYAIKTLPENLSYEVKSNIPKNINFAKLNQQLNNLPDSLLAKALISLLRNCL